MPVKTILVTGGAGYVGSHVCKALYQAGYCPVVYDNLVNGNEWAVQWGPFEIGDISNRIRLNEVFSRYRPLAVMHFAAYAYVGESVQQPAKYYRNNVAGTLTLLEAMRDYGVDKLVFSSTCAIYGKPDTIPIAETHPQHPINPYGHSKLMVERILMDCQAAFGLRSVSLRYFNAAGADPDAEIGECHEPETHLIPLVLDVALGNRLAVTTYGGDYETPDGTCVRDYIHVADLADAHLLALERLQRGEFSAAYNLGNGQGFSVRQVIDVAKAVTGREVPEQIGSRRAGDPPVLVGDARKAIDELGWQPQRAELEEIIQTAWNWALKTCDGQILSRPQDKISTHS